MTVTIRTQDKGLCPELSQGVGSVVLHLVLHRGQPEGHGTAS